MKGLWKERVGDKLMITTETKKFFGLFSEERWFYYDNGIWEEIIGSGTTVINDMILIHELDGFLKNLPLTYSIR